MRNQKQDPMFLRSGHYVGLKFEEGWLFINVIESNSIDLKPWVLLNENGNRDVIAPDTAGSDDDEILTQNAVEIVEPRGGERELFFQLFVGVEPSRMQLESRFGRNIYPNLENSNEPGDNQVWIDGYESPYNRPSPRSEVVTFNQQDKLALQAYNPMDEPREARLSIHVNKVRYAVVEDVGLMRAFIQGQRPFKSYLTGNSIEKQGQQKVPNWMSDAFGDVIMTTEEILSSEETTTGNQNRSAVNRFPQPGELT